jgi:hypothetical protein
MENVTSEQELKQLLEEGKISQDEYEQLLSAMSKHPSGNLPLSVPERPNIPAPLKIVAWLFIIGGIFACIDIVTSLRKGHVNLNLAIIGIFIGFGLLKLHRGWRTCALVFLWIFFIGIPIISMFYLTQPSSGFYIHIFGQPLPRNPIIILLIDIIIFLLLLWMYRVLIRPEIRSLFGINNH